MTEYTRERLEYPAKARAICESVGAEYIEGQDYYLCTDADGVEHLHGWGDDEPTASNHDLTSWYSPGYPPTH